VLSDKAMQVKKIKGKTWMKRITIERGEDEEEVAVSERARHPRCRSRRRSVRTCPYKRIRRGGRDNRRRLVTVFTRAPTNCAESSGQVGDTRSAEPS